MKIGTPKETFAGERRVAMTPDSATALQKLGHDCVIEAGAGLAAGFVDADYKAADVEVVKTAAALWKAADVVAKVRVPGLPTAAADRARTILIAYVEAAQRQGKSFADIVRDLKSGAPAVTVARVELGQAAPDPNYACAEGCAFCCILTGADGGTITEAEARMLHAALLPRAGAPDGRAWHPRACPALDPATRGGGV